MSPPHSDERVLVLALTRKDGMTTRALLESARIESEICGDVASLVTEISRGAAALVIAEEWMPPTDIPRLAAVLHEQPA